MLIFIPEYGNFRARARLLHQIHRAPLHPTVTAQANARNTLVWSGGMFNTIDFETCSVPYSLRRSPSSVISFTFAY